jgi:dUTP pyrophosphatase
MKIRIQKTHPAAIAPLYATDGAGCFDLHAVEVHQSSLPGVVICDTGLAFEVPPGYVLSIKSRSGLAFNFGIMAFPGEVDSDYRGTVKVMLIGPSGMHCVIRPGDRIAQARLVAAPRVEFEVCEQLTLTERGDGGFGSTGA